HVEFVSPEGTSRNNIQSYGVVAGSLQVPQESDSLSEPDAATTRFTSIAVDVDNTSSNFQSARNPFEVTDKIMSQLHTSSPTELPTVTPQPVMPLSTASLAGSQVVNVEASPATVQLPNIPALDQITDSISLLTQKGQTEVRLHLQPETLGHLMVKLHMADGNISVRMFAETPQAQALIQEHMSQLKMAFAAQGL
ncbi:MAG: flagellar hook-length control protein FliK, partial [Anaerolineae bacterium]|nr:flagellar hook-length control protein FliK [Anaerolineae bacterium]